MTLDDLNRINAELDALAEQYAQVIRDYTEYKKKHAELFDRRQRVDDEVFKANARQYHILPGDHAWDMPTAWADLDQQVDGHVRIREWNDESSCWTIYAFPIEFIGDEVTR